MTVIEAAGPDDRVDGVPAARVARPESIDEVAEVLREADHADWSVVPRGRGTKLTWGAPPGRLDLLLDLGALDQVVEHEAGDLVVVAQAGVGLADLQARLAGAGQRLALDEMVPGSTLGGLIATGCSGPHRLGFGSVRDLLIGITMVRADGVVAKTGGKVVKNVAGYDLAKLLTGAYGTLGVVVQAAFRLHPLPARARWVETLCPEDLLSGTIAQVLHSQLVPVAVEVDWPIDRPPTLAVLFEGSPAGVDRRSAALAASLPGPVSMVDVGLGDRHRLGLPFVTGELALKFTCRLSAAGPVLDAAHRAGASVRGSAGVGVFHGSLPVGSADSVAGLRALCAASGGSLVILDAPAAVKPELDLWGPVPALALMTRVKDQFDPRRRLAAGRFVGGL